MHARTPLETRRKCHDAGKFGEVGSHAPRVRPFCLSSKHFMDHCLHKKKTANLNASSRWFDIIYNQTRHLSSQLGSCREISLLIKCKLDSPHSLAGSAELVRTGSHREYARRSEVRSHHPTRTNGLSASSLLQHDLTPAEAGGVEAPDGQVGGFHLSILTFLRIDCIGCTITLIIVT